MVNGSRNLEYLSFWKSEEGEKEQVSQTFAIFSGSLWLNKLQAFTSQVSAQDLLFFIGLKRNIWFADDLDPDFVERVWEILIVLHIIEKYSF